MLGDISKTIHPVEVQGFNLAIRSLIYLINLYDIHDYEYYLNMFNQYKQDR
ncbi:MAG: hypothetical protein N4P91_00370 [Candidatus Lightella neohaematopini]|nr:hypothetical protein [Candidatus Lightella neohaematopini]